MFSNAPTTRLDFADTRAFATDTAGASPLYSRMEATDAADLLAGADAADAVWQAGQAWLRTTAAAHVPPEFADGFLQQHPLHRLLMAPTPMGPALR